MAPVDSLTPVNFSLARYCIVDPTLDLFKPKYSGSSSGKIYNLVRSEIIARVYGLALSLFAALDVIRFFLLGCISSLHFGCAKLGYSYVRPAPSKQEVLRYFKLSAQFVALTAIGSFVAFAYPSVFKHGNTAGEIPAVPQRSHPVQAEQRFLQSP